MKFKEWVQTNYPDLPLSHWEQQWIDDMSDNRYRSIYHVGTRSEGRTMLLTLWHTYQYDTQEAV